MSLEDGHAGEEHVQVGRDHLLEQHELARLDLDETRQDGGHLDPSESLLLVVRVLHADCQRQAEGADVREGMAGVDGQRRQDRVDLVCEALADGFVVVGYVGVVDDADSGRVKFGADSLEDPVLLVQQFAEARPNRRQLLGGGLLAGRSRNRVGLDLLHQDGDAYLEELIQVAGNDGQELDSFQQWISLVQRLMQHPALESQRA